MVLRHRAHSPHEVKVTRIRLGHSWQLEVVEADVPANGPPVHGSGPSEGPRPRVAQRMCVKREAKICSSVSVGFPRVHVYAVRAEVKMKN